MNKILLIIFLFIFLVSCTTVKYAGVPLSAPPSFYYPYTNIQTKKDFFKEYQRSLIKIKEWQKWYDIQISTNYFYTNN